MNASAFSLTHLSRPPIEPPKGKAPLLVLLHGVGSNEQDLMGLAEYLDPRWHLISARAPIVMGPQSFGWFQVQWDQTGRLRFDMEEARASVEMVKRFVQELYDSYEVDPSQTYLVGFSQGAILSSAIMLTAPDTVAGAVLMSGRPPRDMAESVVAPEQLRNKPIIQTHGLYDEVISIEEGRALRDTLAVFPVALDYSEYPMGHTISLDSLNHVNRWLADRLSKEEQ